MINIQNGITEMSGNQSELMGDFIVLFSAFKHFVNTVYPDDPEKATECMISAIGYGLNGNSKEKK